MNRSRQFPSRAADGGFSLLEVIVAVSVLAIAVTGMMALYFNTAIMTEFNQEVKAATFASQQKLEEIRGTAYTSIATSYPAGTTQYFAVPKLAPFVASDPQAGSVVVDYGNPSLLNVTVRVHWNGVRGEGNLQVTTMISPP